MHDKKLGRNPFEKKVKETTIPKADDTVLFQEVVKPQSDIEKLKQMQIQVDWNELYKTVTKNFTKFFILVFSIYLLGCASNQNSQQSEMRKHIVELQKIVAKQSTTIEELNNKIYLLSDRVDHYQQPDALKVKKQQAVATEVKPGDLQLYEMAMKDLKSNFIEGFTKKVELLTKGFKNSPLTNNALFMLGEYHFKNKNYLASSQVFEKLYGLAPDGNRAVSTLFMLGLNYQMQNRIQEAKEAYQTVLNIYPGSQQAQIAKKNLMALQEGKKK